MNLFNKTKEAEDAIESKQKIIPLTYNSMENVVKLVDAAKEVNSRFTLCLKLSIGEFEVDSNAFKEIKLLKASKNQDARIIISFADTISSTETTIELQYIEKATVKIEYSKTEEVEP